MTENTLAINLTSEPTDTSLLTLPNDAITLGDNGGTLFVYDYLDPGCNSNASGLLASGASFTNLVTGGAAATATINSGTITNNSGLVFSGSGTMYIDAGLTYCPPPTHAWVAIGWAKMPASGLSNNDGIMSLGTSTSNYLYTIEAAASGANMAFGVGAGSPGASGALSIAAPAAGTIHQFAIAYDPSGVMTAYLDGALVGQAAAPLGSAMIDYSSNHTRLGTDPAFVSWRGGTIYRHVLQDLTVSGNSPLAVVANDFNLNNGRFT
jgi:hypothetical protein